MLYSFDTILLSAQKTGDPNLIGTVTASSGVTTTSLSTLDKGITFTAVSPLVGSTTTLNIEGSKFVVDKAYHGSVFALSKIGGGYTTFTHSSAVLIVPAVSQTKGVLSVDTPDSRRKYLYGYI
tara:strand:- start:7481 stop:7849 length:369 start_codon:yes stop_codon:yes gene_type:complete